MSEQIESVDGITDLPDDVAALQESLSGLIGDLSDLADTVDSIELKTNSITDYLVDSQEPTADNNYTWYRKYDSGWVEQGGFGAKNEIITLAVTMKDTNYGALAGFCITGSNNVSYSVNVDSKTTTSFRIRSESSVSTKEAYWHVYGFYQKL